MRTSCSFRVNCRFRLVILAVALGPGALALGARADGTGWAERIDASFAIGSDRSVIGANDLGLVNGVCTFNGRIEDVARVQGLYAPPYFCTDFDLNLTFDGKALSATRYVWRPEVLTRSGACDGWRVESRLYPLAGKRGAIMAVACVNGGTAKRDLALTLSASGACGRQERWGFSKPSLATGTRAGACPVRWSLGEPSAPARLAVAPGETNVFHVAFAIGAGAEAEATVAAALADPSAAIAAAVADWRARVARLADRMPEFRCSDARLERLYNRSLLHLLLCTWRTDAFRLNPYLATGGMNGGCICCYLWNLGGPFRMLPLYDPEALKAHLDVLYALDLTKCYAFAPSDGSALGPYYMINQEKMINLVDAYVRETGDLGYLNETHAGKKVIAHVVDYALAHDDLAKEAVLVDYGSSNSHLELRRQYRYNGTMPDLNLRRIALLHQADALCRLARYDPKVDLTGRARALRRLVRKELWDPGAGWFRVRLADGKTDLRWTMQMFKTFGWGEKVLDRDVAAALLGHLMNPDEFLGSHGIHSLSKRDPAYDPADVDNGGPGACPSFPASVAERLFRDGHVAEAQGILSRLLWLGEKLPYWGDSQYADRADYRRDTPLQCDIEGACLAQTIVFGLFGVTIGDDLRVSANPHLPPGVEWMSLTNLRLAGKRYDFAVPSAGAAEAASDAFVAPAAYGSSGGRVSATGVQAQGRRRSFLFADVLLPPCGSIGTVTPWSLCDVGKSDADVAAELRQVKARTGIAKFVLYGPGHSVRQEGLLSVDGYRELGRRVRQVKGLVAADGIDVGYLMMPTMNAGVNHPWQSTVRPDGQVRPFTPCPGEAGFREAFAAKCAALAAECRPFLYMMEDDFRFFFGGCFCESHLKRFAALTGVVRTREELVKALREPSAEALRARWHRLQQDDILAIARVASAAIAAASPETRVGLSAPGYVPENDIAALARVLAGNHRPYVRWWGAKYGYDAPLDTPSHLFAVQWSVENVGTGIENVYESDIYPHTGYYASAVRMTAFMSQALAYGLDGVYHWVPRQTEWNEFPDYLGEYRASAPRLRAIRDEAQKGRSVGIRAAYDPCSRIRHELQARAPGRLQSPQAVSLAFGRLGFPVTTHPAPVTAYVTHYAFDGKSDADIGKILSGNVFLDGAAAEVLTERGFASLIGVEATARDRVDFTGEAVSGGSPSDTVPCSFHANAGIDGSAVSRLKTLGAEASSFYFSGSRDKRVQPSLTRFANARGGRIVTMAANLAGCSARNVFNTRKRALLDGCFVWLGGDEALPIRTVGLPNVMVTANANVERLFVHALNLNADPVGTFRFRVSPSWRGAVVEILDGAVWRPAGADAAWNGDELSVRAETPILRTLVIRLHYFA